MKKNHHTRIQETANRIIEAFRRPDELPAALAPLFVHRYDDVPCRQWSWHNQFILALHHCSDARGFRQWNTVGRRIKPGSRAIWILAPRIQKVVAEDDLGEENETKVVCGFRAIPVFDLIDTEGQPLTEPKSTESGWIQRLPLLEVARAWNIEVHTYAHRPGAPLGRFRRSASGNQYIMLGTENAATWAHELVHAADYRLTWFSGPSWQHEVVAELGAAVLLACLGKEHDADLGGAFSYIEAYAHSEGIPMARACVQMLERTCQAVGLLLDEAERIRPAKAA